MEIKNLPPAGLVVAVAKPLLSKVENEGDDGQRNDSSIDVNILQRLSRMKKIIFLDLENFSSVFQHLTNYLPDQTFVFVFSSSNIQWKPPKTFISFIFSIESFSIDASQ